MLDLPSHETEGPWTDSPPSRSKLARLTAGHRSKPSSGSKRLAGGWALHYRHEPASGPCCLPLRAITATCQLHIVRSFVNCIVLLMRNSDSNEQRMRSFSQCRPIHHTTLLNGRHRRSSLI